MRTFEGVLGLLERLGEAAPVLLVIEDLHWADQSTRDLLTFLARNVRGERLLLVASFRADELHRRHPLVGWLGEAERLPRVERIDLQRFNRPELAELVSGILGALATPALLDSIESRSDGNAFFAEELVSAVGDDGAFRRRHAAGRGGGGRRPRGRSRPARQRERPPRQRGHGRAPGGRFEPPPRDRDRRRGGALPVPPRPRPGSRLRRHAADRSAATARRLRPNDCGARLRERRLQGEPPRRARTPLASGASVGAGATCGDRRRGCHAIDLRLRRGGCHVRASDRAVGPRPGRRAPGRS